MFSYCIVEQMYFDYVFFLGEDAHRLQSLQGSLTMAENVISKLSKNDLSSFYHHNAIFKISQHLCRITYVHVRVRVVIVLYIIIVSC